MPKFPLAPLVLLALLTFAMTPAISRLLFFYARDAGFLEKLNRRVGRFELTMGLPRDIFVLFTSLWLAFIWSDILSLACGVLGLTVLYNRWWRVVGLKPMAQLAWRYPLIHPQEFFDHLYCRLGFLPHPLGGPPRKFIHLASLDFTSGERAKRSFWITLQGIQTFFVMAGITRRTFKWFAGSERFKIVSGLAFVWATRLVQLARMRVITQQRGVDGSTLAGKKIFAFTHKSFFDSALFPIVLFAQGSHGEAANFSPRFLVAKDHFKDNIFIGKMLGLAKMLEAWGMIFVDRRAKNLQARVDATQQAARKMLRDDRPLAMFPQGTRAAPQRARDGSRWDASYFLGGRTQPLKKGIAYIALEVARQAPVFIIPIGVQGTGTTYPKGSWTVQTETVVEILYGDPIEVSPTEIPDTVLDKLDSSFQRLLDIPTRLERRFLTDLRTMLPAAKIEEVAVALKSCRGASLYAAIDQLYTKPMKKWPSLLMGLVDQILCGEELRSKEPHPNS